MWTIRELNRGRRSEDQVKECAKDFEAILYGEL